MIAITLMIVDLPCSALHGDNTIITAGDQMSVTFFRECANT